jgi:hypothetical protein
MATLYLANCNRRQAETFICRVPEHVSSVERSNAISVTMPRGGQRTFPGDWNDIQLGAVERHLRLYGNAEVGERVPPTRFVHLLFSRKPIPAERIAEMIDHNDAVLSMEGQRRRHDAAVAASFSIDETLVAHQLPDHLVNLSASVQEESSSPTFADGVKLERGTEQLAEVAHKRRNRRRRTSE